MADDQLSPIELDEPERSWNYSIECKKQPKNGFVVLKDRSCKIIEVNKTETEVHVRGNNLFTGELLEESFPLNCMAPNLRRIDYELLDINKGGWLGLMKSTGETRDNIKIPDGELGEQPRRDNEAGITLICTVMEVGDEAAVVAAKRSEQLDN